MRAEISLASARGGAAPRRELSRRLLVARERGGELRAQRAAICGRSLKARQLGAERLAPFRQRFAGDAVLACQFLDRRQAVLDRVGALRIHLERIEILLQAVARIFDAQLGFLEQRGQ